jgi:hypothetical protein
MPDVAFTKQATFLGRNGMFKSKGLIATKLKQDNEIVLEPITSRNVVGRCHIAIPIKDLDLVIEMLQKVKGKEKAATVTEALDNLT